MSPPLPLYMFLSFSWPRTNFAISHVGHNNTKSLISSGASAKLDLQAGGGGSKRSACVLRNKKNDLVARKTRLIHNYTKLLKLPKLPAMSKLRHPRRPGRITKQNNSPPPGENPSLSVICDFDQHGGFARTSCQFSVWKRLIRLRFWIF